MRRLPIMILGAASAGAAAALRRARRAAKGGSSDESPPAAPVPDAARQEGLSTVDAPPPPETPGPSVNAPTQPESETERAERADAEAPLMDAAGGAPTDLAEREEAAAAAEAGSIGGTVPEDADGDPSVEPVAQAGGGVAEGFEAAEQDLAENAEHGDGHGEPMRDALRPERESDLSTAEYAEGNRRPSTEVTQDAGADPGEQPDPHDPGEGPGVSAER